MENFKNTMKEIFSVTPVNDDAPAAHAPEAVPDAQSAKKKPPLPAIARPKPAASFLAPGTAFEGTLRSEGDIEIAGGFKGDLTTRGTVILRSDIQSNITAGSLSLSGCSLTGDVVANGTVSVSEGSKIVGSVTARELLCAGEITGDLKIAGNTTLEQKAQINGSVLTGTLSVVKGAVIVGSVEMKLPAEGSRAPEESKTSAAK